jgi:hypothetical protein
VPGARCIKCTGVLHQSLVILPQPLGAYRSFYRHFGKVLMSSVGFLSAVCERIKLLFSKLWIYRYVLLCISLRTDQRILNACQVRHTQLLNAKWQRWTGSIPRQEISIRKMNLVRPWLLRVIEMWLLYPRLLFSPEIEFTIYVIVTERSYRSIKSQALTFKLSSFFDSVHEMHKAKEQCEGRVVCLLSIRVSPPQLLNRCRWN